MMQIKKTLISAIQHYALDDGPGIRTTVFLKGCSLACLWCHNPETIRPEPEIAFHAGKCVSCGDCVKACLFDAIHLASSERIDRTRCDACGSCADVCPALALQRIGNYLEPGALVFELLRDRIFYEASNGGVTFSGGEPALHMDYLSAVMKLLKENNIHIAIQTAGFFNLNDFADKLLPYLDLIFYDLKFIDSGEHERWTGKGNTVILTNFLKLTQQNKDRIIPRIPLVPGITAKKNNLLQIADFIQAAGYDHYELMPYNSAGTAKHLLLGKSVPEPVKELYWKEQNDEECKAILAGCFSRVQAGCGRHPVI